MDSFVERNDGLRQDCLNFISKTLSDNGNKYEFVEEEFIGSDDFEEVIWDLAIVTTSSRHGDSMDFAIVGITFENELVWFHGVGVGEDEGEKQSFTQSEIETGTLCDVADMVKDLFKTYKIN